MPFKIIFNSIIICLFAVIDQPANAQQHFVVPIAGNYGQDFIIVNYVDWGPTTTIKDSHCDSKTYDGHQGTDFVIRDFSVMDSGIQVRAAAKGKVIFIQDGLFDREKTSVISKRLGNYVGISHHGNLQTYYAHLRKGSISVSIGDSVLAGQTIGMVGSSGNSESPHLHFELWYDSTYYIDPFSGMCGNPSSYWQAEPTYNPNFSIWTSGMVNYICSLDTLKEGLKNVDTFYVNDPVISYWNLQYGLRTNDSLRIDWRDPNGGLWFSYGYKVTRDWWYYYFSSYINTPVNGPHGEWTVKYYRNNNLVSTQPFYYINSKTDIPKITINKPECWNVWQNEDNVLLKPGNSGGIFKIYDLQGILLNSYLTSGEVLNVSTINYPPGIFIIEYTVREQMSTRKKLILQK